MHSVRVVSHSYRQVCLAPGLVGAREKIIWCQYRNVFKIVLFPHLSLRTSSKPFIVFLTA